MLKLSNNIYPLFLLPILSGLFLLLSFPPFNQGYMAWLSLLPLFFYCRAVPPGKRAFFGGLLTGMVFFLYLNSYIALSVNFLFSPLLGILVVVAASLYPSLYIGVFALSFSFFLQRGRPMLTALAAPALWVLLEYLRSAGLLGFSGGLLGYSQAGYTFLFPLVSTYGYWGLPFSMILFQVALFFLFLPHEGEKTSALRRSLIWPFILLSVVLVAGFTLPSRFPVQEKDETLRIALLQGNISQADVLDPAMAPVNFQKYITLTKEAADRYGSLDLIVWPETVFSLNVARYEQNAAAKLASLAKEAEAPLMFGAMIEDKHSGDVFNSILLQRAGQPAFDTQRYDKQRLVPFAEYFPLDNLLNMILNSDVSLGTYTPGGKASPFYLNNFTVGGIVCFESFFPGPALQLVRGGAEHIFILTNDAWFLESHGVQQHADAAPFRAAELGVGVTQVANTGLTRSYNYRGEKILDLPPYQEGIALLETSMAQRQTLYRLFGDYFVILCAVIFIFCLIQTHRRSNIL